MKHTFKERVASYAAWRKSVLLMAPLEIVLILVVGSLLVMTFIVGGTTTVGKRSIAALRSHLQGLQARMADPDTLDPEAERELMEVLINKVKATCEQPAISGNKELEELFGRTHTTMQAIDQRQVRKRVSWLQFKGVTNSFYELYFPRLATSPFTSHTIQ